MKKSSLELYIEQLNKVEDILVRYTQEMRKELISSLLKAYEAGQASNNNSNIQFTVTDIAQESNEGIILTGDVDLHLMEMEGRHINCTCPICVPDKYRQSVIEESDENKE